MNHTTVLYGACALASDASGHYPSSTFASACSIRFFIVVEQLKDTFHICLLFDIIGSPSLGLVVHGSSTVILPCDFTHNIIYLI